MEAAPGYKNVNSAAAFRGAGFGHALGPFLGALALACFLFFASGILIGFSDLILLTGYDWAVAILFLAFVELLFRGFVAKRVGLMGSLLLFILVFFIGYSLLFPADWARLIVFLFFYGTGMSLFKFREDEWACAITAILYVLLLLAYKEIPYSDWAYLQLFMLSLPLYLKMRWKGIGGALEELGIRKEGAIRNVAIGIAATFALIALMGGAEYALRALGLSDLQGVQDRIEGFPQFIVAMAFTLTPVSEEFFFRGMLFPAFGVVASSLLFAVSHYGYGSASEIIMSFAIAFTFCWLYKKTGSLIPPIVSHALFNAISLAVAGRL
jgi:membrane protease YdiL (CAAX protease family)